MDVKTYLHPLMKKGLTKDPNSAYNALINSLNAPLTHSEEDILRSKTNVFLASAPEDWLDTFGSWLGLKRKPQEDDDTYRTRLMEWVLVDKNDVSSIRNAIANFLNIGADSVYIYEPYTSMLYYNDKGSDYNSLKYFASSYYNYCVIDVQIDGTFPIREIQDIINLFRPAGVIYVLTINLHSFSHDAPIIDNSSSGDVPMGYDVNYYAGFNQRVNALITPNMTDDITVDNPFYWSSVASDWNEGNEYQNADGKFKDYMILGASYFSDYDPDVSDTFDDARMNFKNYDYDTNNLLSRKDTDSFTFNIGYFDSDYNPVPYTTTMLDNMATNDGNKYVVYQGSKGVKFTFDVEPGYDYAWYAKDVEGNISLSSDVQDVMCVYTDAGTPSYTIMNPDGTKTIDVIVTTTDDAVIFKEPLIIKLNNGAETDSTHAYNASLLTAQFVGGVAKVMSALQMHYGLSSSVKPGDIVKNYYPDTYLTLTYKTKDFMDKPHALDLYLYDFSAGIWSLYKSTTITNDYQQINLRIDDFTNLLNNNGLMFYRINTDVTLDVDYFALSFSNYEFNTPPLSSYFVSPNLVTTTNFNNGIIGEWDRSETTSKNLWRFNDPDIGGCWIDAGSGGLNPSGGDIDLMNIPVKPNITYMLATPLCSNNLGNSVLCWYDKDHKYIPNASPLTGGGQSKWTDTSFPYVLVTSPSNAAYCGISLNIGSNAKDVTVTFCEGTTYLPYPMKSQVVPNQDTTTNKQFKYVLEGNGGLGKFIMGNDVKHVAYGDTYQIDAWVNTTSGFKVGLVDPDCKYFYAGSTIGSNSGGWQHVTGQTSISTYNTTTRVQPLIEILNDDCKFQLGSFTITRVPNAND